MSKKKAKFLSPATAEMDAEMGRINDAIKDDRQHTIPPTGRRNPKPMILLAEYLKRHR